MKSPLIKTAQQDGKLAVLFDSGIRTGSDIIKAVALGAQGILRKSSGYLMIENIKNLMKGHAFYSRKALAVWHGSGRGSWGRTGDYSYIGGFRLYSRAGWVSELERYPRKRGGCGHKNRPVEFKYLYRRRRGYSCTYVRRGDA